MEKPKPKQVYWQTEGEFRTDSPELADSWRRWRKKWPVVKRTVYSARELREWERQREAEIRREERGHLIEQRDKAERERDEATAFLRRTAMGRGAIVSSANMMPTQIAVAHAAGRVLVTPDGCGYVYVPETMSYDGEDEAQREVEIRRDERAKILNLVRNRLAMEESDASNDPEENGFRAALREMIGTIKDSES